jgi:drug/metabolite transporter (DMT)-like permease
MKSPRGILLVALGAALWGTDTLLRRPLTTVLDSSRIVLYEHLTLTIILLPFCWRGRREWKSLTPLQWAAVLGTSWGGSALGTVCFTEAVKIGNPTTAVLLQKIQPVFAALLARALLGESLGRRFWMWLMLALAAGWLISFGWALPAAAPVNASAALFATAAAALWGGSTVLGRFLLKAVSFTTLTALRIVLAVPLLLGLAAGDATAVLNARQVSSVLAMALVPGLLALLIYYRGLRETLASRATIAELSFPATATLLNFAFLGARLAPVQAAGFALLWVVIVLLGRDRTAGDVVYSPRKELSDA